jgi:UrcA family protein
MLASVALLSFGAVSTSVCAEQIRIAVTPAGLDLSTRAGTDAFHQRINAAALQVCMQSAGIDNAGAGESLLGDCVRETVKAAMARNG